MVSEWNCVADGAIGVCVTQKLTSLGNLTKYVFSVRKYNGVGKRDGAMWKGHRVPKDPRESSNPIS